MPQQLALALTPIENEPRIRDLDLAERLGFVEPRAIRKIIKRHEAKLLSFGTRSTVSRVTITGQPSEEYYLNQKQAIFICMKSETDKAIDVQMEIVHTFDAYLKGELTPRASTDSFATQIQPHLQTPVQVQHSKDVNAVLFAMGGPSKCAEYHSITSYAHTGKTPTQLKQQAKEAGVPSKWRQTGRGAIRQLYPAKAAGISMQDYAFIRAVPLETSIEIGRSASSLLEKMEQAGLPIDKYLPEPTP